MCNLFKFQLAPILFVFTLDHLLKWIIHLILIVFTPITIHYPLRWLFLLMVCHDTRAFMKSSFQVHPWFQTLPTHIMHRKFYQWDEKNFVYRTLRSWISRWHLIRPYLSHFKLWLKSCMLQKGTFCGGRGLPLQGKQEIPFDLYIGMRSPIPQLFKLEIVTKKSEMLQY